MCLAFYIQYMLALPAQLAEWMILFYVWQTRKPVIVMMHARSTRRGFGNQCESTISKINKYNRRFLHVQLVFPYTDMWPPAAGGACAIWRRAPATWRRPAPGCGCRSLAATWSPAYSPPPSHWPLWPLPASLPVSVFRHQGRIFKSKKLISLWGVILTCRSLAHIFSNLPYACCSWYRL